ncbi:MAG: NYN domain-containing protein [Planctomycetaceae bacterium]|nr:NYN domain-containing protein [Planctomycetaceae bacterium]
MPTAILVDGGFFLPRYHALQGSHPPEKVAGDMHRMCLRHLRQKNGPHRSLYRIFYYDCPPLTKKAHHPLTGKAVDFSKTPTGLWRSKFLQELKRHRKVAIRLGYLNEADAQWTIHRDKLKALLNGKVTIANLSEHDVRYHAPQKGVDMRIGLDISSMCFKCQVDQIVLVAGDSDFVPAAKLARREGVDFILDPMWARIRDDLHEHIDGLRSVLPQKQRAGGTTTGGRE